MLTQVLKYLEKNGYGHKLEDYKETFMSHPDYPSLFAITDAMTFVGIDSVAAKVSNDNYSKLPDIFLTFINSSSGTSELIIATKDDEKIYIQSDTYRKRINQIEFLNNWKNIVIAIDKNENTNYNNNKINLLYYIPLGILLLAAIFSFTSALHLAFLCISFVGLILSILILREKYEDSSEISSSVCNFNENISCSSVINSKFGKINSWLGISDLPILFFTINYFSLLLIPASIQISGILSVCSIPLILYLIWIQKAKVKKICVLCILTSSLLTIQAILWIATLDVLEIGLVISIKYIFIFTVFLSIWVFIKSFIEKNKDLKSENIKMKKFKRNFSVFKKLQSELSNSINISLVSPIIIGNISAPINISMFLSPSCGHCHEAFEKGFLLAKKFPNDIKLQILFNVNTDNDNNPFLTIVENIQTIKELNPKMVEEALSDWHLKKMKVTDWLSKWQQKTIPIKVKQTIKQQYEWCIENNLKFTPIKILNNKIYPNEYDIEEISYFIEDIKEQQMTA